MAEGTSLLRMHTAYTCIVSSNLTVSARNTFAEIQQRPKTPVLHSEAGGFLFRGVRNRPAQSFGYQGMDKGMRRRPCNLYPQNLDESPTSLPVARIFRQEDVCPN